MSDKEVKIINPEDDVWDQAYKCHSCGNNVNFTFIMQEMKAKGLCPDCYWREEENG